MSVGSSAATNRFAIHQSLTNNKKQMSNTATATAVSPTASSHYHFNTASSSNNNSKFSYRSCPICEQRLLVRINGSFPLYT
ncbi:hypothetical protein MBANPS3_009117 [Mucor bainieri]